MRGVFRRGIEYGVVPIAQCHDIFQRPCRWPFIEVTSIAKNMFGKKEPCGHDHGKERAAAQAAGLPVEMFMAMGAIRSLIGDVEGLQDVTEMLCQYLEIPRKCEDAAGNELKVGDVLSGGQLENDRKTVLAVGWRWAEMSRTDDQKKLDAKWYQVEIKERGWIKL